MMQPRHGDPLEYFRVALGESDGKKKQFDVIGAKVKVLEEQNELLKTQNAKLTELRAILERCSFGNMIVADNGTDGMEPKADNDIEMQVTEQIPNDAVSTSSGQAHEMSCDFSDVHSSMLNETTDSEMDDFGTSLFNTAIENKNVSQCVETDSAAELTEAIAPVSAVNTSIEFHSEEETIPDGEKSSVGAEMCNASMQNDEHEENDSSQSSSRTYTIENETELDSKSDNPEGSSVEERAEHIAEEGAQIRGSIEMISGADTAQPNTEIYISDSVESLGTARSQVSDFATYASQCDTIPYSQESPSQEVHEKAIDLCAAKTPTLRFGSQDTSTESIPGTQELISNNVAVESFPEAHQLSAGADAIDGEIKHSNKLAASYSNVSSRESSSSSEAVITEIQPQIVDAVLNKIDDDDQADTSPLAVDKPPTAVSHQDTLDDIEQYIRSEQVQVDQNPYSVEQSTELAEPISAQFNSSQIVSLDYTLSGTEILTLDVPVSHETSVSAVFSSPFNHFESDIGEEGDYLLPPRPRDSYGKTNETSSSISYGLQPLSDTKVDYNADGELDSSYNASTVVLCQSNSECGLALNDDTVMEKSGKWNWSISNDRQPSFLLIFFIITYWKFKKFVVGSGGPYAEVYLYFVYLTQFCCRRDHVTATEKRTAHCHRIHMVCNRYLKRQPTTTLMKSWIHRHHPPHRPLSCVMTSLIFHCTLSMRRSRRKMVNESCRIQTTVKRHFCSRNLESQECSPLRFHKHFLFHFLLPDSK